MCISNNLKKRTCKEINITCIIHKALRPAEMELKRRMLINNVIYRGVDPSPMSSGSFVASIIVEGPKISHVVVIGW